MRKVKKLALFLTFFSFVIMTCFSNVVFAASMENDATDAATTESVADEATTESVADEVPTENAVADEVPTENDVADEATTENVADEVPTENDVAEVTSTENDVADEATTENVADLTSTENNVADGPTTDNGANLTPEQKVVADAIIRKIAPDGKNAVFKVKKPTSIIEGDFLINGYVQNLLQEQDYEIYAGCYEEPYTTCTIQIYSDDYKSQWDSSVGAEVTVSGWKASYTINVTYDEPKPNSVVDSVVDSYLSTLESPDMGESTKYYCVEDLSLINYYLTGDKSELWNPGAPGRALKFSTLNSITSGSNVSYYIDVRAGEQDEALMYESAFGPMSIFYNGYSYGTKEEGLYLKRVIYIPENTKPEDYVAAAQKRINDYLGNSSVVVSYGGLLSSLPEGCEDQEYSITSDGNYYNVKVGNRTYKFYIVKAPGDKLVEPTYLGTDIESKVEITSEDSAIPLDTSLTVKDVTESSTKDKIGTENYKSYDISLYSNAKDESITKINGKFTVKIPVPAELNGKELVVYYIPETGDMEEHEVTIKDGCAIFTTDHFSTYTLAEKVSKKAETPAPDAEISKKPQAPDAEISEKPQVPQTENKNDTSPITGDASPIIPVVFVLFASLAGGLVLMIKKSES